MQVSWEGTIYLEQDEFEARNEANGCLRLRQLAGPLRAYIRTFSSGTKGLPAQGRIYGMALINPAFVGNVGPESGIIVNEIPTSGKRSMKGLLPRVPVIDIS